MLIEKGEGVDIALERPFDILYEEAVKRRERRYQASKKKRTEQ
jgi:hypothetical protein